MAHLDISSMQSELSANTFFELGLRCSTGKAGPEDLVAAHKWFNLAALKGNVEAAQHRQEIARTLSSVEIAQALRDARAELLLHYQKRTRSSH